jgi:pimeloyl-ACP methyl ester carboxylesterase
MAGATGNGLRASTQVVVSGMHCRVLHAGPTSASEAVVFVHGNAGRADAWADLVGRVAAFARPGTHS